MPAAVETAVFSNTPAWHRLGTVIDTNGKKGMTVEQALELSGIDWEVRKAPALGLNAKLIKKLQREVTKEKSLRQVFQEKVKSGEPLTFADLEWIDHNFGVQRQTDSKYLGVVGSSWTPVQNREGFQIVNDVIEQAGGTCWIEAAGALDGGARVWVLAHLDTDMQIAGEKYAAYLLFCNGHNGRVSVTAACEDVRVVCANTLDYGLMQAKQTGRVIRIRHTTKAAERIKEAHTILGMRNTRAEELAKQGEWLADQTMDDGEFNNFLETLMPVPEDSDGKPAETMAINRQDKVRSIYFDAENLAPIRGTVWSGIQSVIEYCDHGREFKNDETALKAQWGITVQPLKQAAYDLGVAFALA